MNSSDPIIVYCMACDEPIYELLNPIFNGQLADSRDFKSLNPEIYRDPVDFEYMICPKCGKIFPDTNPLRIKTNKGMMPHEPK